MDHIVEPESKLVRFGPEVIEAIRKEYNLDNKEDREQAIAIIDQWVKAQDHLTKKDFSKGYIERCLVTCKGSLERTKKQIDKMCTLRTFMPRYFEITNVLETDLKAVFERGRFALLPTLTKEHHRVVIFKIRPSSDINNPDFNLLFKLLPVMGEYLKAADYCQGYTLINDIHDSRVAQIISQISLVELQQFIPLMTEGYGVRIKGIIFLTGSKIIEGFVKIVRAFFSEKIASRINVVKNVEELKQFLPIDILPEEYGGKEQSIEILHEHFVKALSSDSHQELMREMNKARTDETKRQLDKFNDQYMGMPGTFRTLSLD